MLVLVLVVLGFAVLAGVAALASCRAREGSEPGTSSVAPATEHTVAMVETEAHTDMDPLTGVVVDDGSHVLVAGIGADDGKRIAVYLGEEPTSATLLGTDRVSGLSLLHVDGTTADTPELDGGTYPGEAVRLLHYGADDRVHSHRMTVKTTDAEPAAPHERPAAGLLALSGPSQNPGPLMDPDGRLVGWVVGSDDGRATAYPVDKLMNIVASLRDHGRVAHGWIGVRTTAAVPAGNGVRVLAVHDGSPAAAGGIVAGDLIDAVDDRPIAEPNDLVAALDRTGPGRVAQVALVRDGRPHELTVTVGDFPD